MTRERALELARRYDQRGEGTFAQEIIANAILAACAEEREACAKIAEDYRSESYDERCESMFIAARIRERN